MSKTSARDIEKHWEKTVRDFGKECLMEHNRLRSIHTSLPLKLSKDLCRTAQKHARQLVNEQSVMRLSEINFGQNVASIKTSMNNALSGVLVARCWYKESENYDYSEENPVNAGHFTQLVWRDSTKVGFGCAKDQDRGIIYIVAHYSPTGNVDGRFVTNVMKPEVWDTAVAGWNMSPAGRRKIGSCRCRRVRKSYFLS
ncbi:hypothetical protein D915_009665 [Fasciola hepatica]|uniref:SCP domain-containing protein n=1 Tax=Fasciola hepatica TaxID=6192 RepID=A0A4E0QUJ2_FASHE|nr:hypothetical protein D915_009665 [Fasciola hepatica]